MNNGLSYTANGFKLNSTPMIVGACLIGGSKTLSFKYLRATVRAIVDFPVPAKPFSQKMQRSSCPSAQSYIS